MSGTRRRIERDALPQLRNRPLACIRAAAVPQRDAEVVARLGQVRPQRDRAFEMRQA